MTPQTKTKFASRDDPYFDQARLYSLQMMVCARSEELVKALGVNLYKSKKMLYGCCPIHGGGNPSACNFYPDGDLVPGYWRCNTKKCHTIFKKTVLGFVRGVLSHQKYGWEHVADATKRAAQRTCSWKEAVDWCCNFLGQSITTFKVDSVELEKRRFTAEMAQFTRKPEHTPAGSAITRDVVRKFIKCPSDYFISRGWSADVLDRYDVGEYPAPNRPLSNRVAVPIYDNDHRFVVGFTGRSVHPQCDVCNRFHRHDDACPNNGDRAAWGRAAKWYNHEFNKESYLYNYWFARKPIAETGLAVLVESPGNIWRLAESGIENGVAMFGVELSDEQQVLLEMSGAMNVVVLTDMDAAGQAARDDLKKRLSRSFRLHFPLLKKKDLGEMTVPEVQEEVSPIIEQILKRGH